jgi:hypothetical protein
VTADVSRVVDDALEQFDRVMSDRVREMWTSLAMHENEGYALEWDFLDSWLADFERDVAAKREALRIALTRELTRASNP